MRLSSFETFSLYIALKNHFSQEKYDFHLYHGKTRISKESFLNRRDRFQFQKLCRRYDEKEMVEFIIANIIQNKKWVGELLEDDAHDNYLKFLKYKQSITYSFDNELEKAINKSGDIQQLFKIRNNQYPTIVNLYLSNDMSIQTLSILNSLVDFSSKFDKKLGKDDIIWSKIRLLCVKLNSFLHYDKVKIKTIIKEKMHGYRNREPSSNEKQMARNAETL